jgi:hypothetical protein
MEGRSVHAKGRLAHRPQQQSPQARSSLKSAGNRDKAVSFDILSVTIRSAARIEAAE